MTKWMAAPLVFIWAISIAACQDNKAPASESKPSSVSSASPAPVSHQNDLETRQRAYKDWRRGFDSNIAMFDAHWKTWRHIFKSFTNGTGDRFSGYTQLKDLASDMEHFKESMAGISPPGSLNEAQRKNLNEAYAGLKLATGKRVEAIRTAMEMLDSGQLKPSVTDKIQSDINDGDTFLLLAWAKVLTVESELNLLEEPKKHKKKAKGDA